jgi:two-component system OmpR family response regulator
MKGARLFVLCVEDDPDTQEMLRVLLEQRGYGFRAVDNCADALALLREADFSLLLLDNQLPDGAGIDLCQEVRRFDKRLPIIFLSGATNIDTREIALRAGANAFLTKPITLEALFHTLTEWTAISAEIV